MDAVVFAGIFGSLKGLGLGLFDVAKDSVIPLAIGLATKQVEHIPILKQTLGHLTKRIPNNSIPFLNLALSAVVPGFGVAGALGAGGLHQLAKVGIRALVEGVTKGGSKLEEKIGPGTRLSI